MVYKKAFTLIEVMVAVMIVSVVIAGTVSLRGNSSTLLLNLQKEMKNIPYASFLPWSKESGLEPAKTNLYRLVRDVVMDDELRRKLKNIPITVQYQKIHSYDMDDTTLELGETTLKNNELQISLKRISQQ